MTDQPDTVTIELPLQPETRGVSVDGLMTALDHAKAYHGHEGGYVTLYENLEGEINRQINEQIPDV